jgi:hypothetical protein
MEFVFVSFVDGKTIYFCADVAKEIDPEVNVERTKYVLVSRDQNASQDRNVKIANTSSEIVSHFKYLGPTVKVKLTP